MKDGDLQKSSVKWKEIVWIHYYISLNYQIASRRDIQLDEVDGDVSSSVDPYTYHQPIESPVELD